MGRSAGKWLQRWLNAFNHRGVLYPDLITDGVIGPRTLNALSHYVIRRGSEGELVLLRALNCSQGQYYLELAEKVRLIKSFNIWLVKGSDSYVIFCLINLIRSVTEIWRK